MTSSGKLKADWLTEKWVVEIISKIMSLALGSRSTTASSWFAWFSACFFYFQLVMNAARRASLASGSSPWIDSLPYRARSIFSEIDDDLKFLVTCQLDHWLPLPIPFAKLVQCLNRGLKGPPATHTCSNSETSTAQILRILRSIFWCYWGLFSSTFVRTSPVPSAYCDLKTQRN